MGFCFGFFGVEFGNLNVIKCFFRISLSCRFGFSRFGWDLRFFFFKKFLSEVVGMKIRFGIVWV